MKRLAAAVLGLLVLPAPGCAASDSQDLDRAGLEREVLDQVTLDDESLEPEVTCEGGLEAAEGASQDCDMSAGEQRVGLHVVATGDSGDFELTPVLRSADLVTAITRSVEQSGQQVESLTCPDELVGEVGETTECDYTVSGESGTLVATVTSVDGLMIDFDFEEG